ncbi:MAG: pyrimidine-nucleoside phosphorylase [Halanaerobiales bacterium]
MNTYDIIYKKREGEELSAEEIEYLISGYTEGDVPDYQMSAWAMAVFFQGMSARETAYLTTAMVDSGETVDLSPINGIKIDKHSTGGVGDTTTLVLAPLVSASGIPIAKMSGRGLGHTGGTIDKLESIPGIKVDLSRDEFINTVNEIGLSVIGQTANLTPADKKLYSLRDVTATVDSIPLIASSIMSKKIAGGADGIILDVKTGSGAFMQKLERSRKLARRMVDIGKEVGKKTRAVITNMDQPLGNMIGNALEVKEAISVLRGEGPEDLRKLCLTLGANMLELAEKENDFNKAYARLQKVIDKGQALEQFKRFIEGQGGDFSVIEEEELLPTAEYQIEVESPKEGYVEKINAREIGLSSVMMGAGRQTKEDDIDLAVGIELNKKVGDKVKSGESLAVLHLNQKKDLPQIKERVLHAYNISDEEIDKPAIIYEIIQD